MSPVEVKGEVQLKKNLEAASKAALDAAFKETDRARLAVETMAKKLIQMGPKTGHMYKRGNIFHQASAPGQAPATDTGTLASSIESKMESGPQPLALVWTEKEYGKWLEFGTRDIEPRPFFTPAVEQNRARFMEVLGKAVVKRIDEVIKK